MLWRGSGRDAFSEMGLARCDRLEYGKRMIGRALSIYGMSTIGEAVRSSKVEGGLRRARSSRRHCSSRAIAMVLTLA